MRDYTAILFSKLLTRPDVLKQGETETLLKRLAADYLECKEDTQKTFKCLGCLQTFVEVFKIGHRDDFLSKISLVFEPVLQTPIENKYMTASTILRKNKVKLAQRIGCIFLKPRITSWRYKRGTRTLQHLKAQEEKEDKKQADEEEQDEEMLDEDEIDFEQLEFIIQLLLDSLKDPDTAVRWTAAKGLGRITQRLTKDFGDQIVEQLHDLFSDTETESTWHGGCLALAELCRRGLLLPERLDSFIKVLDVAMTYDISKGNHSVGSHVRDAACYVVWSFARAYSPEIMKPHVHMLSNKLIVVSMFDREVNCRRAASATFQECVGRQGGIFPHGIEILTEADYFTLSNRTNAYLNVSCFVGQFDEYFAGMVKHLAFTKLFHWEPNMRTIASQALSVLCVFQPEFVVKEILTPLIEKCLSKALHIRHGAILGVGEILIGLSGNSIQNRDMLLDEAFKTLTKRDLKIIEDSENKAKFKKIYEDISSKNHLATALPSDSEAMNAVRQIIAKIEKERLYKGKGGEIMRAGVCHLIHSISVAKISLSDELQTQLFMTMLENFKHPNTDIQDEANKAFKSFCFTYFDGDVVVAAEEKKEAEEHPLVKKIQALYKPSQKDLNIAVTRGYNMAFGVLTKKLYDQLSPEIFDVLVSNCVPKGDESDEAETRKQALRSLVNAVETCGV